VDPTQPVQLENGEKVSVDVLPPTPVEEERRGLAESEEVLSSSKQSTTEQRTQQGMHGDML
jgi:predicted DNA-binding antitoxin AbrB/MazE fold protein